MDYRDIGKNPNQKRIIVVGGAGRLGATTLQVLMQETNHEILAITRGHIADRQGYQDFDSTSPRAWKELADNSDWRADVIINTAAMTNVDQCEKEREKAWRTNVDLVDSILWYCRKTNARMIQVSTDYVFDGKGGPYTENSRPEPINYYGRTKLAAENLCTKAGTPTTIVRTMWLYGESRKEAPTFSSWVRNELQTKKELNIVGDEFGNPTLYSDLANGLTLLAETEGPTLVHAAGRDRVSRAEWAEIIADVEGYTETTINPIESKDLKRPALRPLNSGLITTHPQLDGITELSGVRRGERNYKVMTER